MKLRHDQWKILFTVTWNTMGTSTFTNYCRLSQLWILEKTVWLIWNQKRSKIPIICPFLTAKLYESTGNQKFKVVNEFSSQSTICYSKRVTFRSLCKKFKKLLRLLPENHLHTQQKMIKMTTYLASFIKNSCLESFNNGLVYNIIGL